MTDVRLQEMLKEGNYAGAIQLCLECLTAVPMYKQYTCISDLGSKLKDTQNAIEVFTHIYYMEVHTYVQTQPVYNYNHNSIVYICV